MRPLVLSLLYICIFSLSFSQGEIANWQFMTRAGIQYDFCFETVYGTTNGQSVNDQVGGDKGPSTISDKYGNLLFYSNGQTIWTKNHTPMPNASVENGTDLKGFRKSLILPLPGSNRFYYIFVIDRTGPNNIQDDGIHSGLNYSIIDLNLNGGLGDVIDDQKNTELITYNPIGQFEDQFKVGNKLTAVRGADCNSYWILTHFRASVYAFKLDENGLDTNPVVSTVAPLINIVETTNTEWYQGGGDMKASPNGDKIAIAHSFIDDEEPFGDPGAIYIYDFDRNTGILDNTKRVFQGININDYPASIEFSSNSNYLYATTYDFSDADGFDPARLLRWNLTQANIEDSIEVIEENEENNPTSLQLGPNGRIYKTLGPSPGAGSNYFKFLGVINDPEALSASNVNYVYQGILIDVNDSGLNTVSNSLPQLNSQWFNSRIDIVRNGLSRCELFLCGNESKTLKADFIEDADYTWSVNGTPIANANSFELEVNEIGSYEVFIEPNDGRCPIVGFADVFISNDVPTANNASLFQCDEDGQQDGVTLFNIAEISDFISDNEPNRLVEYYESQQDAINQTNSINSMNFTNTSNPQIVYALVINTTSGCSTIAEVSLEVSTTNANDAILSGCDIDTISDGFGQFTLSDATTLVLEGLPVGLEVTYYLSYGDALVELNPLNNEFNNTIPYTQIIYARVEDGFNCYGISEVTLNVFDTPTLEIENETIYCLNTFPEQIILTGGIIHDLPNNYFYDWSTGETTSEIQVNEAGVYTVRVTNVEGCFKDRTITVLASDIATIEGFNVMDASQNNTVTVLVSGEGDYEFALDNVNGPYQDSNTFEDVMPGVHTVYVRDKNNCGIAEDLVSVIGFPRYFTPNGDGNHDFWQVRGISAQFQPNTIIYIFDRYGKLLAEIDPRGSGWDGMYNGQRMPSSDYWFSVQLEDGRQFSSHFTLKR